MMSPAEFVLMFFAYGGYVIYNGDDRHVTACDPAGLHLMDTQDSALISKRDVRGGRDFYYFSRCSKT